MANTPFNSTHSTAKDVNSTKQGTDRLGGLGDAPRSGEFGTVVAYYTDRDIATVRTERGRTLTGVGRMRSAPGELAPLTAGTEVLLSYAYGAPLILGIHAVPSSSGPPTQGFSVSDVSGYGGDGPNKATDTSTGNYRNAREPTDTIPGDWAMVGDEGNMVALLAGGVALLKSSTLAQIRTHLLNDMVEIISRNFRHITDMGEFSIQNNEGKINMRFRGASDQQSEAGPDEERWTIKMDLGAEGDMFNFELCTPHGQTLFKFHVDSEGAVEIFGINGVALTSGSRTGGVNARETTGGTEEIIGEDRVTEIRGSDQLDIGVDKTTTVSGDLELNAGNDYRLQALRDLSIGSGRNATLVVQGDNTDLATPALTFDIEAGDWVISLGSALNPTSGMHVQTYSGDVSFKSTLGGNFEVASPTGNLKTTTATAKIITGRPNSVVLGGDSVGSNIAKYQELQEILLSLFNALDTHTHMAGAMVAAGTLPVSGLTAPPLVPIGAPLVGKVPLIKSIVAGVSS